MAIDGTLMARARERLARTKAENEAEHARRLEAAYARVPELREVARKQQQLFSGIVSAALRQGGGDISAALKQLDEESAALSARRAELLRSAGWPEDYLDEINACPLCHDSGMLTDGTTCSCLKRLYEAEQARQHAAVATERRSQVGSGDRSERIRTYNFPQNRVTDHRLAGDIKNFNIDTIINGDLDGLIDALTAAEQTERLREQAEQT